MIVVTGSSQIFPFTSIKQGFICLIVPFCNKFDREFYGKKVKNYILRYQKTSYMLERGRKPSEIIQTLQKEGIIDQMRQAGIIRSDQSVERLLEKAQEVERSTQRARVKGWWVVCGSCGGKGICLGCIEGEF